MTAADVFALCNQAAIPGWLLLIAAPRWAWTHRIVIGLVLLLSLTYVALFVSQIGRIDGGYGSLDAVTRLLSNPYVLSAAWVHFLAFDLFIGSWITRDSLKVGVSRIAVVPCLVLTFLAGPAGLLLYLAIRMARTRTLVVGDHNE